MPEIKLEELILCTKVLSAQGDLNLNIADLSCDSRNISEPEKTLFFAIVGTRSDGHDYIPALIGLGVKAFVISKDLDLPAEVTAIKVEDVRVASADISCKFYSDPTKSMTIVGVTGTKGKTTTTKMITSILEECSKPTGLIGTIEYKLPNEVISAKNTTPDAMDLQSLFYRMKVGGCTHAVMEVSSHAIALERIAHVDFDVAVLTNVTSDHMDFHKTVEDYIETKASFFSTLGRYGKSEGKMWPKVAIVNADDPSADLMIEKGSAAFAQIYSYACDREADFKASKINIHDTGLEFTLYVKPLQKEMQISSPLVGKFNVYNILAAITVCFSLKLDLETIKDRIAKFSGVAGRFQRVDTKKDFSVIVDYAHTEGSLENVLKTARDFTRGRLITVFGCGGDRDRSKRPKMGNVSAKLSDFTIITSDNPRSEDPLGIIEEIKSGMPEGAKYMVVPDRREAIKEAIAMAQRGDTIMIAGKGHETYQIFRDETVHFDDLEEAKKAIADLG